MQIRVVRLLALVLIAFWGASPAAAQITTGTVTGTIRDQQGGVIPGATVVLISESRGTKLAPVITNATGDFVVPNVTADTYIVEVTMESFKTARRAGITVSGADRVGVPPSSSSPARSPRRSTSRPKLRSCSRRARSGRLPSIQC